MRGNLDCCWCRWNEGLHKHTARHGTAQHRAGVFFRQRVPLALPMRRPPGLSSGGPIASLYIIKIAACQRLPYLHVMAHVGLCVSVCRQHMEQPPHVGPVHAYMHTEHQPYQLHVSDVRKITIYYHDVVGRNMLLLLIRCCCCC